MNSKPSVKTLHISLHLPPSSRALDNTKAVGSLPGLININPLGAADYSIPIDLPPGTAGMTPELSLHYNSMAGNGILGIGWNISGISSISRIGQDRFNDGDIKAVDYVSDRLTMDGKRLILKSGTWFASTSQYRTQNESFSQITYNGTYFIVLTPSGNSIYYGSTPDSRYKLINDSKVLIWYITKIVDPFGNTIDYTYRITENMEYLIDKIEYTKTPNFIAYNSVQFNYEKKRADFMMAYKAGIKFDGDYILKSISVKANGTEIKNLTFRYFKNTNNDSYLSYIENKGASSLQTNTTQINWINRPGTSFLLKEFVDYEDDAEVTGCTAKEISIEITRVGKKVSYTILDADGDGKSDILTIPSTDNSNRNLSLRYNGLASKIDIQMPAGYNSAIALDYDGDGMNELLFHKGNNSSYGTGFSLNSKLTYYGAENITGSAFQISIYKFDKSTNSLKVISPGISNYGITGLQNYQYKLYQADMDGNGLTDLIFANHATNQINYQVYLAEVVSGNINFVKRAEGTFNIGGTLYTVDFNGNGKQDLICNNTTGIYVNYFSKISGQLNYAFGPWQQIVSSSASTGLKLSFGDLNGDNKVDILDSTNCKKYFSIGLNSSPYVEVVTYSSAKNRFIGADYNADGKNEIISQSISSANVHQLTNYYITGETTVSNQQLYNNCRLHQFLFGDFNGDGIMEKLFFHAGINKSTITIYYFT